MSDKKSNSGKPAKKKKDASDAERKMLESAFEHVMVPLAILDRKFNFIRVNRAFAQYAGRPVHEFAGRNYFEFFPNPENVRIFMNVVNTGNPYTAWGEPEAKISPEGSPRYWDWSLTPAVDETGKINHLVLSWADVTEREEAKAERQAAYNELEYRVLQRTRELRESGESLRKTQETLDLAMEVADMGAWVWDLVSGKMVWSKRRKELFGLDPEQDETLDTFLGSLIPEDREPVRQGITTALENKADYDLQMRVGLPDGRRRWIRTRGRGFYDENGKPVRLAGMAWDVSELRENHEKLKESEERFRLATLAANEAVWDWDCRTNTIIFNEIFQQKYGRPDHGTTFDWWFRHLHPEDSERIRDSFREALRGAKDRWDGEYRFRMPDGSYGFMHDRAYLFRDESGKVRRIVGAMLDLTERNRIEEELRQLTDQLLTTNRELESYTYIVSHDLRGPLRALDGYTKMILKDYSDQFDSELKRRFNIILESTADMDEMIEALLRLSRACNIDLRVSRCDMKDIFRETWEGLKKVNPDRNMKFILDENMPEIPADCRLMKQAVYNLLSNAVKFTRNREEAVIEAGSRTNGEYTFYVKDNGAGFDMKHYERLFNIFQRLHSAKEFPGIGVGLPIVQRIIVRHGGKIWAEGEIDRGATFYISMPKKPFRLEK